MRCCVEGEVRVRDQKGSDMRKRIALSVAILFGLASLTYGSTATAAPPADRSERATVCTDVRIDATIPTPPVGMRAQQSITVDDSCVVRVGPTRLLPATRSGARAADGDRQLRLWSEMYDCCAILMNALYATHTWRASDGHVTRVRTAVGTDWNREPWNGGWKLAASSEEGECDGACQSARLTQHAEFGYRGIFDVTGTWYYNTHELGAVLTGDGAATCELRVTARHWFVGWTWIRGCA